MQYALILVALLTSLALQAQQPDSVRLVNLYQQTIYTLCADSLGGRPCCNSLGQKTTHYLANTIKQLTGKAPVQQNFSFKHPDSTQTLNSTNLIYYVNNKAKNTILIIAHADHIGLGGALSKSFKNNQYHPGADDNASGVALLLGLLSDTSLTQNKRYNYIFAVTSAHEIGLYGSSALAKKLKRQLKKIALVINFDMVGRLGTITQPQLTVYRSNPNYLNTPILANGKIDILSGKEEDNRLEYLDTKPFYKKNIPCLSITTSTHNDYHKTSDTPDKINYPGIYQIHRLVKEYMVK